LGWLYPAFRGSKFRVRGSRFGDYHKYPGCNSPPAPPSGWSGGTLDIPWTSPIPIEPAQTPVFDQPDLFRSLHPPLRRPRSARTDRDYAGGSPVIPRRVPDVDHQIPFIFRAFSLLFAPSALGAAFAFRFGVGGWKLDVGLPPAATFLLHAIQRAFHPAAALPQHMRADRGRILGGPGL
jgi:hypothetical protein